MPSSYNALFQGIFLTQGFNLPLLGLLHWEVGSLSLVPPGKPQSAGEWIKRNRSKHIPIMDTIKQ